MSSLAERFSVDLTPEEQAAWLDGLTDDELTLLRHEWSFWARPEQLPPPGMGVNYSIWLLRAGRGFGKTRAAAEAYIQQVREQPAGSRGLLVGATMDDARQIMIEGESGLIESAPPDWRPVYFSGLRKLVWPNGSYDLVRSADRPDRLRGPQHCRCWGDEFAAWRFAGAALDHMLKGLRLGRAPWAILSTTPKSTSEMLELEDREDVAVTGGSSYENLANLSDNYRRTLDVGVGTAWHTQEVLGITVRSVPGALWTLDMIHAARVLRPNDLPEMARVVVGVDPPGSDHGGGDECGIVVDGLGADGHGYTLGDHSGTWPPTEPWGRKVLEAAWAYRADCIVVEGNRGGAKAAHAIRMCVRPGERCPRIKTVTARVGKLVRAEPVQALYADGRWHHYGTFGILEGQMTTFVPGVTRKSPDRLDAHVYAGLELFPDVTPARLRRASKPVALR